MKHTFLLLFVFLSGLLFVLPIQAAELRFDSLPASVVAGDQLQIFLRLDTQNEEVNAVEGRLSVSQNLKILSVQDGQSTINIWNERPKVSSSSEHSFSFSGIAPGGYLGSNGLVFSLILQAKSSGQAQVTLESPLVLKNDGLGSQASTSFKTLSFKVGESQGTGTVVGLRDLVPPESFNPQVTNDPNLFNNKYFLIFQTVDKQSGIDHYEVLEVPTGESLFVEPSSWQIAESPFELKDQGLTSDIYIRAVDRVGNFIVAKVPARFPLSQKKSGLVTGLWLLVFFASVLVLLYILKKIFHFTPR